MLRLPDKMQRKKKIARAEEVLLMLGLKDCANVLVGGALVKGISGGLFRPSMHSHQLSLLTSLIVL